MCVIVSGCPGSRMAASASTPSTRRFSVYVKPAIANDNRNKSRKQEVCLTYWNTYLISFFPEGRFGLRILLGATWRPRQDQRGVPIGSFMFLNLRELQISKCSFVVMCPLKKKDSVYVRLLPLLQEAYGRNLHEQRLAAANDFNLARL